ncbi:hypothetical protein ACINB_10510 [Acidovorax sp. NB1]|nr:hypothetical protein ACINB_10510 [Acidovorax sp. NB1]
MASVADGSSASAMAGPTRGTMVASDMEAMVMKNSAASAMGCRQNARMPSLTQAMPVRAGTMWSFIEWGAGEDGPAQGLGIFAYKASVDNRFSASQAAFATAPTVRGRRQGSGVLRTIGERK